MLPAVWQGVIAAQCRKEDSFINSVLEKIDHRATRQCATAERSLLKTVGGDCDTAIGGYATLEKDVIRLRAQLFSDDGKKNFIFEDTAHKNDFLKIGKKVGENILKLAGASFKRWIF